MMGFGGFGMGLGLILTIGLIIGLVLLMIWAVRMVGSNQNNPGLFTNSQTENPMEILKARYAKGEITKEEYEEMRQTIS